MEFSFPFKLRDGTELIVTAEVTETECILGLTFPIGCRLEGALFDAYPRVEEMEEAAIEKYRERLREIREARGA